MPDDTSAEDVAATNPASEPARSDESEDTSQQRKKKRRRRRGKSRTDDARDESRADTEPSPAEQSESESKSDTSKPKHNRGGRSRSKKSSEPSDGGHEERDRSSQSCKSGDPEESAPEKEYDSDIFAAAPFDELGLRNSVMKGVREVGFERATYIQAKLIPAVLSGVDVLGQAKTGSGKTAAFGLPLFHMATRSLPFQSIVLCPTRELAIQIASEMSRLGKYTPIKVTPVYGGQAIEKQTRELEKGPEIIVATPGRLMDLIGRRKLHFDNVKFVVLDEVDRMLDIGFRDDIKKILRAMKGEHQTIFVSATISGEIETLGRTFMREGAAKIVAAAGSLTVSLVEQHYLTVEPWDKRKLLTHLLTHEDPALTVVFCRTKRTVDDLTAYLCKKKIDAHAIHGDMYQGKRNAIMQRLRKGELGVLIASDLAARGLDVDGITHVVNYDLPEDPEVYIHRIGRTARAGRKGVAWSLVTPEQGKLLSDIEKLANVEIPLLDYPDFVAGAPPERVIRERAKKDLETEQARSQSRYQDPDLPVKTKVENDARFPMGLVPTKQPPKRMQGRLRTSRSKPKPTGENPPTE